MRNLLLLALCFQFPVLFAQESDCMNALFEANKLYESGQFQSAVDRLESCVKGDKITRNERLGAVRLLSICHLMLQNQKEADFYAKELLILRPEYKKYPFSDPREFTSLLSGFAVSPRLIFGLHFGVDQYGVRVIQSYTTAPTKATYIGQVGFSGGIDVQYQLSERLSLGLSPTFQSMRYAVELDNIAGARKEFSEIISALEIPLFVKTHFKALNQNMFLQAGPQALFILNSYASVESTNFERGALVQSSTETTAYRTRSLPGVQAMLGASYPFGKGMISLGISAKTYFSNFTDPDKRYSNSEFILSSGYIDSDFSLQSLGIQIGWQTPVQYVVRKVK